MAARLADTLKELDADSFLSALRVRDAKALEEARAREKEARQNAAQAEGRAIEAVQMEKAVRAELQEQLDKEKKLADKLAAELKAKQADLASALDREAKAAAEARAQADVAREQQAVAEKRAEEARAALAQLQDKEKKAEVRTRAEQDASVKYMRRTAELFVEAAVQNDYPAADSLLSKDCKKSIVDNRTSVSNWISDACPPNRYKTFKIGEEVAAPSGDEAIFSGLLAGAKDRATFSVRVLKDKESGRYQITLFTARSE
jgi:hypothetical protein